MKNYWQEEDLYEVAMVINLPVDCVGVIVFSPKVADSLESHLETKPQTIA